MTATHALTGVERPATPCTLVIFGATGDLTRRKLLPALYHLKASGLLPGDLAIVGVGRKEKTHEAFREEQARDLRACAPGPVDEALWMQLRAAMYYHTGGFADPGTYTRLAALLDELASRHRTGGNVLFYLATPPGVFSEIARQLGAAGLTRQGIGGWRRLVVEKPFGRDLDSARQLNRELAAVLDEGQIYRIDHYLGKETVQNIMVFRFANGIFEPVWNRRYVDHVQITVSETVGVEDRGDYYETAGVLRDMIQNHIFQLLALVAMEPPISFEADAVRDERVKVLKAIRPMKPEDVLRWTVRGQYREGRLGEAAARAYRDEPKVSPTSTVETYAALRLEVENWRWAGVPFYVRSGKRLPARDTEISIQFRRPPLLLFHQARIDEIEPNRLVLHIQPDEGIELSMKAKRPGTTTQLQTVKLDFTYKDFGDQTPATGYERLLYDAMVGDSTLYHRTDMVEAAWAIATPVLDVWQSLPPRDFPNYAAGTWGPAAADELIERDGRRWRNPS